MEEFLTPLVHIASKGKKGKSLSLIALSPPPVSLPFFRLSFRAPVQQKTLSPLSEIMSAPQMAASSSRRQSASSSAVSSPMAAAEELDGFAAALALQEAAARPGLAKKEVARLLEKVKAFWENEGRRDDEIECVYRRRHQNSKLKKPFFSFPVLFSPLSSLSLSPKQNKTKNRPALATRRPSSEGPPHPGPSTTTPSPSPTFRGYLPAAAPPPETAAVRATPQQRELLLPPLRR